MARAVQTALTCTTRSSVASVAATWLSALALSACSTELTPRDRALVLTLSPVPAPRPSPTNAVADDPAAAALGKALFFDPALSADAARSCASCHDPAKQFTDGLQFAAGVGSGPGGARNVPSVETVAWQTWFFWDGRADSAWSQATGPIRNPIEMNNTAAAVRERVLGAYEREWAVVFGPVADDPDRVLTQVGKAIEAFERTISPGPSRFDRYVSDLRAGVASAALSEQEVRGLHQFIDSGCVNCHNGPLLTDHSFHNIGVPQVARGGLDAGRAIGAVQVQRDPLNCLGVYADRPEADGEPCPELRYLDSSFPDWPLAFKTPSLRNVTRTAPYMHDGSMATLDAVLSFYSELPGTPLAGHRELTLQPLRLTAADRADLVAFLGSLDGAAP